MPLFANGEVVAAGRREGCLVSYKESILELSLLLLEMLCQ